LVFKFRLFEKGVQILGDISNDVLVFNIPLLSSGLIMDLAIPACILALIIYVESYSVSQSTSTGGLEKVNNNQELFALGASNLVSAFSAGLPVAGGLSRSMVSFKAGARTQVVGILTAFGVAFSACFLTQYFYYIPNVVLACIIVSSLMSLINLKAIKEILRFSKSDCYIALLTILATLLLGGVYGIVLGTIGSLIWATLSSVFQQRYD